MDVTREVVHGDVVVEFCAPACENKNLHESGEGFDFEVWECICRTIVFLHLIGRQIFLGQCGVRIAKFPKQNFLISRFVLSSRDYESDTISSGVGWVMIIIVGYK